MRLTSLPGSLSASLPVSLVSDNRTAFPAGAAAAAAAAGFIISAAVLVFISSEALSAREHPGGEDTDRGNSDTSLLDLPPEGLGGAFFALKLLSPIPAPFAAW